MITSEGLNEIAAALAKAQRDMIWLIVACLFGVDLWVRFA